MFLLPLNNMDRKVVEAVPKPMETYEGVNFDSREYGDLACCVPKVCCCQEIALQLGPEETILKMSMCMGACNSQKKVPYGELSGVELQDCCCFVGFMPGSLTPTTGEGGQAPIQPGCGCSRDLVTEIVEELKARQYHRGDAAKMRTLEKQTDMLYRLEKKIDILLENIGVKPDDVADNMTR
mmetsp:Transcript_16721/g.18916  ORF Transcript_16721/g.18916 Transcript_16721/m.18916 type:complete len:181 (+) Transcript_16721:179-721(+)